MDEDALESSEYRDPQSFRAQRKQIRKTVQTMVRQIQQRAEQRGRVVAPAFIALFSFTLSTDVSAAYTGPALL